VTIGDRLGSYEILAPLGEGGMGEVYYLRFVISKGLRASGRWPAIARMLNLR